MASKSTEKFNAGNRAFVDEDYELALKYYTDAIDYCAYNAEYYFKRCNTYLKLEKYKEAIQDADSSINLNDKDARVYHKKGVAQLALEKYEDALVTLQKADSLNTNEQIKKLLEDCKSKLKEIDKEHENQVPSKSETSEPDSKNDSPKLVETLAPAPKMKYDWYQTETHVIVTALIKNLKTENVSSNFTENSLSFTANLPNGNDFSLELDLAHPITPSECTTKVMSTKVEMKLKKQEGIRWSSLEEDNESQYRNMKPVEKKSDSNDAVDTVHKYPSSSHMYKNWDRLAKQIQEEEKSENLEGDAALNKLFQQIYADGSDEVKRAMNKSFQESGGTVLSTNWKDVKKEKVEVKPPDCMEYKKYEY